MTDKKVKVGQTCARPPTAMSKVVRSPESIRDTRTLAGPYLTQRPDSVKRSERKVRKPRILGHPPTAASQVAYNPESIRDTRTLAGPYLTQRPDSVKRS